MCLDELVERIDEPLLSQPEHRTLQVGHHRRTITQREMTYRCEWCSLVCTEFRYPGPLPRYCCSDCKRLAQNSMAARRMKAMRERNNPTPHGWRRGPGRPKQS